MILTRMIKIRVFEFSIVLSFVRLQNKQSQGSEIKAVSNEPTNGDFSWPTWSSWRDEGSETRLSEGRENYLQKQASCAPVLQVGRIDYNIYSVFMLLASGMEIFCFIIWFVYWFNANNEHNGFSIWRVAMRCESMVLWLLGCYGHFSLKKSLTNVNLYTGCCQQHP